jgi:hypothetical protein
MAKSKNKRKQPDVPAATAPKRQKAGQELITPPPDNHAKTISSIGLCDEDIELAIDTLNTLKANPAVIKTKACKDLRTAVYDFSKACTTGLNATSDDTNLTAKISGALADGKYTEARILLAEMGIRRQKPKLGALCRWVRDLDVVSGLAEQLDEDGRARTEREEEALMVLDAVLRLTGPTDHAVVEAAKGMSMSHSMPIIPRENWNLRDDTPRRKVYNSVLDRTLFSATPVTTSGFKVLETTPGAQRKPPNLHPAILYTSQDDAIPLSAPPPNTTHHQHPVVPNLHLLKDVLSPSECEAIIAAGETLGFTQLLLDHRPSLHRKTLVPRRALRPHRSLRQKSPRPKQTLQSLPLRPRRGIPRPHRRRVAAIRHHRGRQICLRLVAANG